MKRYWPVLLVAVGLLSMLAGYVYAVLFAGIPYQDPTPQMLASYTVHSRIAATLGWFGLGALVFGMLGGSARLVARRSRR